MKYAILNGSKVYRVDSEPSANSIECSDLVEPGWIYTHEGFTPPPGSLAFAKKQKNAYINMQRSIKLEEPILYGGNLYDTDKESSTNLTAVVSAITAGIPLPANFTWRTASNDNVPLDATQIIELAAAMLDTVNSIYNQSWDIKSQIDLASTISELDSILW